VAARLLFGLEPRGEAAWKSRFERVYAPAGWEVIEERWRALAASVRGMPGLASIRFDASRMAELEERAHGLAQASEAASGDDEETRRLRREFGALKNELAVLRLVLVPPSAPVSVAVLEALIGSLHTAQGALRRLGIESIGGLAELRAELESMRAQRMTALRVVDADDLHAFLGVYTGESCLRAGSGSSSGIPGYLGNANTKQMFAYRGDDLVARSIMFLRPIRGEGYTGQALHFEFPLSPDRSSAPLDASITLFRAGLEKAKALGVPMVIERFFLEYAAERGEIERMAPGEDFDGVMTIDPGVSPVTYTQFTKLLVVGREPVDIPTKLWLISPEPRSGPRPAA
jgi:hypothetical protein